MTGGAEGGLGGGLGDGLGGGAGGGEGGGGSGGGGGDGEGLGGGFGGGDGGGGGFGGGLGGGGDGIIVVSTCERRFRSSVFCDRTIESSLFNFIIVASTSISSPSLLNTIKRSRHVTFP